MSPLGLHLWSQNPHSSRFGVRTGMLCGSAGNLGPQSASQPTECIPAHRMQETMLFSVGMHSPGFAYSFCFVFSFGATNLRCSGIILGSTRGNTWDARD